LPVEKHHRLFQQKLEEDALKMLDEILEYENRELGKRRIKKDQLPFRQLAMYEQNAAFFAAHRMASMGGGRILEKLVKMRMSVTAVDANGQTPLYYAAKMHNLDAMECLIKAQCDVNRRDTIHGQSCLYYAAREDEAALNARKPISASTVQEYNKRRRAAVDLLLFYGCNVDLRDDRGYTVADYFKGSDEDLKELLRYGPATVRKRAKRPIRPPWRFDFTGKDGTKYIIRVSEIINTKALADLEDEFVADHQSLFEKVLRDKPPNHSTCMALGLNPAPANRKNIISSIAAACNKLSRTLTVVDPKTGEIDGYLYFKCKQEEREKFTEISHLKVRNSSTRRGIAKNIFLAVSDYLEVNALAEFREDMRLNVVDANKGAIKLYESIGFVQCDEVSMSDMKEWKDPPPQIGWRRYRRTTDPSHN